MADKRDLGRTQVEQVDAHNCIECHDDELDEESVGDGHDGLGRSGATRLITTTIVSKIFHASARNSSIILERNNFVEVAIATRSHC